ncbi:MAG TPA: transcription termination factor NusA [Bryobacteraceae bacterium]|jgi:N utilization substance protein A|nr:transcription termination factor NusA [Bryobacteraceae bacterium]
MSMGTIYQSIEILSKEKGIEPKVILDAVKDAMLVAARKHFHTTEDLVAEFDEKTGAIQIYGVRKVVPEVLDTDKEISLDAARRIDPDAQMDAEVRFAKPTEALGRISAQTAKQVILQKVREAERENIFSEYSGRVGELVTCVVKRIEGQDLVADLGKTEARIPKKEQSKLESFSVGDRIRCVIKSVEKAGKNAGVIVSRAAPELVMRLFEQEVPEIYDNTVVIKGCAREAGERTKIAVSSRDRDVDSVGACVGMKGMRVQSIIRELRGEKIDIIEFNDDPVSFATHALSPAKISRVSIIDSVEKHMEVIVDDTQLSLAIGKKGQNVRLAAKLLGWRIDIKSEEEKRQEVESQMAALVVPGAPVAVLMDHGLVQEVADKLMAAGVGTVEKLGAMTPEQLEEIPGIDQEMVENIQTAVVGYYGQFEEQSELETGVAETAGEAEAADETEGPVETSNDKAIENESDRIESTEVPAAALGSGKGEAEIS